MSEPFDSQRILQWFRPRSALERAQRSEDHFVVRLVVIVVVFVLVGAAGVLKVKKATVAVQTAYELVRTSDDLRMQLDENRRLEAQLTGLKNPNVLRREATEQFDMHAPSAGDFEEVE